MYQTWQKDKGGRGSEEWTDAILYLLEFSKTLTFPIFPGLLSAKPHKYETNGELSVVIASFVENTNFMWISEVRKFKKSR